MNIYFDTEFTGLVKNTTLISIGLISENNRTFYAEFTDMDWGLVTEWIEKNVINNLKFPPFPSMETLNKGSLGDSFEMSGNKELVANFLRKWLSEFGEPIQLVSDVCHYDMVLFIDIFGSAFSIPAKVAPVCHDINADIARLRGITDAEAFNISREHLLGDIAKKVEGIKHNALYDARVIKALCDKYKFLEVENEKN